MASSRNLCSSFKTLWRELNGDGGLLWGQDEVDAGTSERNHDRAGTEAVKFDWVHRKVTVPELTQLSREFDAVILATGAGTKELWADSAQGRSLDYIRWLARIYCHV